MNIIADLEVAARLALSRGERENSTSNDHSQLVNLIEQDNYGCIQQTKHITMAASESAWINTGIELKKGETISYFMDGCAYANKLLNIWLQPSLQVWGKVGAEGEVFRGTQNTNSHVAEQTGVLFLSNFFPNNWASRQGTRKWPSKIHKQMSGEIRIFMIVWKTGALEGLRSLNCKNSLLSNEIERLGQPKMRPADWHYLWEVGPAEIFTESKSEGVDRCITCCTHQDVAILQRDVDFDLAPTTELSWEWMTEQLPSNMREDSLPSHDYLSIAVEFENGRDISYFWSRSLPVGKGFDCPVPNWSGKEFHVVVRSGDEGLGNWLSERRNLHTDYRKYMGDPPSRIVRIWLIAASVFQQQTGRCHYANIQLSSDQDKLKLY